MKAKLNTATAKLAALALLITTLNSQLSNLFAQGTAFTYQGRLADGGNPANGFYDFQFRVFDTAPTNTGTSLGTPNPNSTNAVPVSNGLFSATVDFGNNPFATGAPRWLDIAVRSNATGIFSTLNPRQALTATPYAITASNVTGVVSSGGLAGTYSGAVSFNNPANSFGGDGSGLTDVNALTLGGVGPNGFWRATGNAGTTPGPNFLGTTDNQALEIKVNNVRALRIEPGGVPNLSGGYFQNSASGGGAVVAGGGTSGSINEAAGTYAFVGAGHGSKAGPFSAVIGGAYNVSLSQFSFIGTGLANTNQGIGSAIVGGTNNLIAALADNAFIGGGNNNTANNTHATIGGGDQNAASSFSTVGGGEGNQSSSEFCTVAGGRGNQSAGIYTSVGGGYYNTSRGDHATVGGGFLNVSASADATVGGGSNNVILANSDGSVISGGQVNLIQSNSIFAAIGGGELNTIGTNAGAATIAGGFVNTIEANAGSSTIAGGNGNLIQGGGTYSAMGGGYSNVAGGPYATVGGGGYNSAGTNATVGGGLYNVAAGHAGAVGGGEVNNAAGIAAAIPGGEHNVASGDSSLAAGSYSTASGFISTALGQGVLASGSGAVALGSFTAATNQFSMAAGQQAQALHQGAFVWADSQNAPFASTTNDQFNIRAAGGVRLNTDTRMFFGNQTRQMLNLWGTAYGIGVQAGTEYFRSSSDFSWFKGGVHDDGTHNPGTGGTEMMRLDTSGNLDVRGNVTANSVILTSDRNVKEHFAPVDPCAVLEKVVTLPMSEWNFKTDSNTRHIGPMAQDFYSIFNVGGDDKHIAVVDEGGVALAAIQGLNQKLQEQRVELEQKQSEITELKQRLERLEALVAGTSDKASH